MTETAMEARGRERVGDRASGMERLPLNSDLGYSCPDPRMPHCVHKCTIQENLRKLCSVDALSRIDVVNLDAWVANCAATAK
jgi:hypothetical protein